MKRAVAALLVLLVSLHAVAPAASHSSAQAQSGSPRDNGDAVSSESLFRTHVRPPNAAGGARLEELGVTVLDEEPDAAWVLVDGDQLEALARLRFEPTGTVGVNLLLATNRHTHPHLREALQPLLDRASAQEGLAAETGPERAAWADQSGTVSGLTTDERAALKALSTADDDGDGLTDTQEAWWCTDPGDEDSDGDGVSDGDEVDDLKAWLANETDRAPATGKPFIGWPTDHPGCYDDDRDSIPDMAERWELGLNMNRESTDRDKFDDGQELFGNTYCSGEGGYCSYGVLPRDADWGIIFAEMPSWVEAPGHHPLVAAFPIPEIDVAESSLHVETVTTVTTDHTVTEGEERSYSTAKTEGTSSSVADSTTWNDWEEVSTSQSADTVQYRPTPQSEDGEFSLANWVFDGYKNLIGWQPENDTYAYQQTGKFIHSFLSLILDLDISPSSLARVGASGFNAVKGHVCEAGVGLGELLGNYPPDSLHELCNSNCFAGFGSGCYAGEGIEADSGGTERSQSQVSSGDLSNVVGGGAYSSHTVAEDSSLITYPYYQVS